MTACNFRGPTAGTWVDPAGGVEVFERRQERNLLSLLGIECQTIQPVAWSLYWLSYPGSAVWCRPRLQPAVGMACAVPHRHSVASLWRVLSVTPKTWIAIFQWVRNKSIHISGCHINKATSFETRNKRGTASSKAIQVYWTFQRPPDICNFPPEKCVSTLTSRHLSIIVLLSPLRFLFVHKQDRQRCNPWRHTLTLQRHSRYRCTCNSVYGHKKSTVFPGAVTTKFTHCSAALRADHFYQISSKSENKCGRYALKLIYVPQDNMAITSPNLATRDLNTSLWMFLLPNSIHIGGKL
jgi:hypothetical protein